MSITINGATNTISSTGTVTLPTVAGVTSLGNTALGDAEASDTHAIKGATTLLASSASAALTVTQTGAGNAFVVEDSASTDSTPFVVTAGGELGVGGTPDYAGKAHKVLITDGTYATLFVEGTATTAIVTSQFSTNATGASYQFRKHRGSVAVPTVVAADDDLGAISFQGYDGGANRVGAIILAEVDGTPGPSDMPGRLVFSTTADGAGGPTERMRIDSAGNVGIGGAATAQQKLRIAGTYPGGAGYSFPVDLEGVIDPSVASTAAYMVYSHPTVSAGTLPDLRHFSASPGAFTGTVTTQYGFIATSTLTGATNNYGFYSNIASAANRYNFYAAGTAANYFGGNVTVGGGGTLGYGAGSGGTVTQATSKSTSVTLNKPSGQITMDAAALAAGSVVNFTLNNTSMTATDVLCIHPAMAGGNDYQAWCAAPGASFAVVAVRNISAGSLSDAVVLNFAVIKGSAS